MQTNRAKLLIPQLTPDLVSRPRLLARLDEGVSRKLTLISAPAGFGKTTLLSNWIAGANRPSAWITIDDLDDDLLIFFSHFVAAIRTIYPEACAESGELLEGLTAPQAAILGATLANDLEALPGEMILVIDDLHNVGDPSIFRALDQLLAYLPPGFHLAIGTRSDPPLSLATIGARGQLSELREHDLCYSVDEAREFVSRAAPAAIDSPTLATLVARAEGWAAGLRLLILSMGGAAGGDGDRIGVVRGDAHIMTFLADEVLRKQPSEVQEFLLRSSVVKRFNVSLCRALAAETNESASIGSIIDRIVDKRLFVVPLGEGWFRYHSLFRELLLRRLCKSTGAEEVADLHRRAAVWYDDAAMVLDSLGHAIEAEDTALAVRVFARHRTDSMNREHWQEIDRWLQLFPNSTIAADPVLAVTRAFNDHMRMKLIEVAPVVAVFTERLERDDYGLDAVTRNTLLGELAVVAGATAFWTGRFEESSRQARRALELLPVERSDARGIGYVFRAFSAHFSGDAAAAGRTLQEAWKEESTYSGSFPARLLVTEFALAFLAFDLPALDHVLARMSNLARTRGLRESEGWSHFCLGRVAYARNELETARRHFEQAVASRHITHFYPAYESLLGLTLVSRAEGRLDDAALLQDEITEFARQNASAYVSVAVASFRAHLALLDGRTDEALQWAETCDPLTPFVPTARLEYTALTYVKTLIAVGTAGRLEEASTRIESLLATARVCGARLCIVELLALQSRLLDLRGDREAALDRLEEAVLLARAGRPVRVFADLDPATRRRLASLLVELARRGRSADAIEPVLAVLPRDGARATELVDPISRREREILALLGEDLSNKEIADRLFISAKTVEGHTLKLYQKLGVRSRREAVGRARDLRLLDRD